MASPISDLFCIVSLAPCASRLDQQWRYDTRTRTLISAVSGRAPSFGGQRWELDAGRGAIRSCVGGCFPSAFGGRLRALFNIAVAGHPELLLQPSAPAAVCISRPEATPEQPWAREPRGQDFVIRSAASGLALGVHNGAVLLAPDAYAELWAMSREGLIWSKRLSLFLDIGGPMAQSAPLVVGPRRSDAETQQWAFWLVDDQ